MLTAKRLQQFDNTLFLIVALPGQRFSAESGKSWFTNSGFAPCDGVRHRAKFVWKRQ
jgi:hypothetical protein